MTVRIKHAVLSEKPQTTKPGVISKNEWNADHVLTEPVLEFDLSFSNSGHSHDGINSAIVNLSKSLNNVYLNPTGTSLTLYKQASSKPLANRIPILDSDGYLTFRRNTSSQQYTNINFNNFDAITNNARISYDFLNTSLKVENRVSLAYLSLDFGGDINIVPKTGYGISIPTTDFLLKNIVDTSSGSSVVNLNFLDTYPSIKGYIRYNYNTNISSEYLQIKNNIYSSGNYIGGDIKIYSDGNIILNGQGYITPQKVYYNNGTTLSELAKNIDSVGSNNYGDVPLNNRQWNIGLYTEKTKLLESWQRVYWILDNFGASFLNLTYTTNQALPENLIICNTFTINNGVTVTPSSSKNPLIIVANTINILGTLNGNGQSASYQAGATGMAGGSDGGTGANLINDFYLGIVTTPAIAGTDIIKGCGGTGGSGGGGLYTGGAKGGDSSWQPEYFSNMAGGAAKPSTGVGNIGNSILGDSGSNRMRTFIYHFMNFIVKGFSYYAGNIPLGGGTGGGGGGCTGFGSYGGGGGAGGACIILIARNINNSGSITANGGNGGVGQALGNAGGGGGGGGGSIVRISTNVTGNGTITANGGNGGNGNYVGGAGGTGNITLIGNI